MVVEQLIYTNRPRGGGKDPTRGGFQAADWSDGLEASTREFLGHICMHYGDAVYRFAPRAALDRENEWRKTAANLEKVPGEVLKEFPVIWTYDRVGEDLYALTRVCYTGWTHDNRLGNFLAQSLIFPPQALTQHQGNPLALTRSDLFQEPGHLRDLQSLSDLGSDKTPPDHQGPLEKFKSFLPALLAGLSTATTVGAPVVLGLPNVRDAVPVLEMLLSLLPPSARCRTTFCTYESDRTWIPSTKSRRPAGQAAAHQVVVLGGDPQRFDLRADEVQKTYTVFNFAGNQFSPSTRRPYADFALECLGGGPATRLVGFHQLIETLGCGRDPMHWDDLAAAGAVLDPQPSVDRLVKAIHVVANMAAKTGQAAAALAVLARPVQSLAAASDVASLAQLAPLLADLANPTVQEGAAAVDQAYFFPLCDTAQQALRRGRAQVAARLLDACGLARPGLLLRLLPAVVARPEQLPSTPGDQKQLLDLIVEGLELADQSPDHEPPLGQLLGDAFQTAQDLDQTSFLWQRLRSLVERSLKGPWDKKKDVQARRLLQFLPSTGCPEGSSWVRLKLLWEAAPQGEDCFNQLEEAAWACARCEDPLERGRLLLRVFQKLIPDLKKEEHQALALGCMADKVWGTPAWDLLVKEYQKLLEQLPPRGQQDLRKELARRKANDLLSQELLSRLLSQDGQQRAQTLHEWWTLCLNAYPEVLECVQKTVAVGLGQEPKGNTYLPLAWQLLRLPGKPADNAGFTALFSAAALCLPLQPLKEAWQKILAAPPPSLAAAPAARLRVLKLLTELDQQVQRADGSPLTFLLKHPTWAADIPNLDEGKKKGLLEWCLERCSATGISTARDAADLVRLLRLAGIEENGLAGYFNHLLRPRDLVTHLLAATAIARCVLEGTPPLPEGVDLLTALVADWDREKKKLLAEHLWRRFRPPDEEYEEHYRQLCQKTGLPSILPEPVLEEDKGKAKEAAPPQGVLKKAFTGWLCGRSGPGEDPKKKS